MAAGPPWEGKATAKLHKSTAEEVWPLFEDFCGFHKWLPSIDTCRKVEGVEGRPGLIRYCAATQPPPPQGAVKWCHEKLLAVDPINKCLSYEVLENNVGLKLYRSTIRVVPMEGGHGCQIEWSFSAVPVESLSYEDMVNYLDTNLQGMAPKMEKALTGNL